MPRVAGGKHTGCEKQTLKGARDKEPGSRLDFNDEEHQSAKRPRTQRMFECHTLCGRSQEAFAHTADVPAAAVGR